MAVPLREGYRQLNHAFDRDLRTIPSGATIYAPGQIAENLYVVRQGNVSIIRNGNFRTAGPDSVFGRDAIPQTTSVYKFHATVERETVVGSIPKQPLHHLLYQRPVIAFALAELIAGRPMDNFDTLLAPQLTTEDFQLLQYYANGFGTKFTASLLSQPVDTVDKKANRLAHKFGGRFMAQAVFTGYNMGFVDGDEAVRNVDLRKLQTLTPRALQILQALTHNGGKQSSNEEIAEKLTVKYKTITDHFDRIREKLLANNRIQAGMMYLVARDRGLLENR